MRTALRILWTIFGLLLFVGALGLMLAVVLTPWRLFDHFR